MVKAFDEIHRKGNLHGRQQRSPPPQQLQLAFAVANGVDAAAFQREYNGFAVNASVQRAGQLMRALPHGIGCRPSS